ncbi:class I adenylate-forming enzyme family protein [Paraburkholderia sp. SOS3]|uniref:class I adenylate-forming enzyme family protein n=1 Tax=Paraburkholderia sp. SOS3 TaxID=1926494 RepID=UPI0009477524|nr:AMP-binding protein [Paraburkholderia sp. SOS3]APR38728.1 AMP-dependent synthetase [Paraburkholderia sp. SOS3]
MEWREKAAFRPYVDVLLDQLERRADGTVLRYLDEDVTGSTFSASIYRHARALATLGIGRGSLVALFAPNCPDALAIRYAANLLGAAAMFLPAIASAHHRAAFVARLQPALLVAFAQTAHLVPAGVDARVVHVDAGPVAARFDRLVRVQSALPMRCCARPDDLAVIVSSGGSTGVPKASRRSFAAYSMLVGAPSREDRRQLVNGALAYLSQVLVDNTLAGGGTVVLKPRHDAADTLATIEAERITDVLLVEPQLFDTMDHPDVRRRDLSSLSSITHIGGSAPAILRRRAIARFGPVLTHTYGASEAGLVSVLSPSDYLSDPHLLHSAGHIRPDVTVRIRRTDGTLAHAGQTGGIEVKSAAVAQGYYHQPVEEAHKFNDGWCMTGDVGFVDEKGCLHVLGRAADVATVDGADICPVQIESPLCALPEVRYAVAVAAAPEDVARGYGWNAVAVPWPGKHIDFARCTRKLAAACGVNVARAVRVLAAQRVPLTEQGKADRAAIGQMAWLAGAVPGAICA